MRLSARFRPPRLDCSVTDLIWLPAQPFSSASPTSTKPVALLIVTFPAIELPQMITLDGPLAAMLPPMVEFTKETLAPVGMDRLPVTFELAKHVVPVEEIAGLDVEPLIVRSHVTVWVSPAV